MHTNNFVTRHSLLSLVQTSPLRYEISIKALVEHGTRWQQLSRGAGTSLNTDTKPNQTYNGHGASGPRTRVRTRLLSRFGLLNLSQIGNFPLVGFETSPFAVQCRDSIQSKLQTCCSKRLANRNWLSPLLRLRLRLRSPTAGYYPITRFRSGVRGLQTQ